MHIAILSASIRKARNSHRVVLYFKNYIAEQYATQADVLDLREYNFPVFEERIRFMEHPAPAVLDFAARIKKAEGIIIVTPEYNGGYPASLKNVIDLLKDEWHRKPVGIATVSTGAFGGVLVTPSLVFSLWKKGAWVVPARFNAALVDQAFDAEGNPADKPASDKRAKVFLDELLWCMEAKQRMQAERGQRP